MVTEPTRVCIVCITFIGTSGTSGEFHLGEERKDLGICRDGEQQGVDRSHDEIEFWGGNAPTCFTLEPRQVAP